MAKAEKIARILALSALIAAAAASLAGCVAPNAAYLMELNRNGKWKEAERVGSDMLAHRRTFTFSQVGETYYHVAYAQTRMGRKDEAAASLREYDDFAAKGNLDSEHLWLDREVAMLKNELGMLSGIQKTLVEAMEENGKGYYSRARTLCAEALAEGGLTDLQLATAHFVAAACSVRLKDPQGAESHLAAFDALKGGLPEGSRMLREEAAVRRGLGDLKAPRE